MNQRGVLARAWGRLVGESDPIERQLAAVAKEGATLARIAHACAFLMLLLCSAGEGVLRDLAHITADTRAPLAEKVGLYLAAAVVSPQDRARLDALLEAAQRRAHIQPLDVEALPGLLVAPPAAAQALHLPDITPKPPTGPGTPTRGHASKRRRKTTSAKRPAILQLPPPEPPGERVRVALASEPRLSIRTLARTA